MSIDANTFFAQLDELGNETVRLQMAQGVYGERSIPLVLAWLQKSQEAKGEERATEELGLARAANDIALVASDHARRANRLATWSLSISVMALFLAVYLAAT